MLVTGGSGLVGTYLLRQLNTGEVYDVYTTAHESIIRAGKNIPIDLSQPENVSVMIQQVRPEVIVNLAASTNIDEREIHRDRSARLNRDLVTTITKYAHQHKAYVVHVSTDCVF